MKRALALSLTLLALGAAAAASPDEKEHKKRCTADAEACIRDLAATFKNKGWVGIEWDEVDGRPQITLVVEGSPAAAAGVRIGDVVTAFNGIPTDSDDQVLWAEMKRSLVPGKVVTLSLLRGGAVVETKVELVAVPDHIVAQWVGMHMLDHHAAPPESGDERSP